MHDIYRGHHNDPAWHDPHWLGKLPKPMTVGIGGPVGSGKTALVDRLCKALRDTYRLAVVTNDIYTREDAEFLCRSGALSSDRIVGVETGGCPHSAIREDASINLEAIADLSTRFDDLQLVFVESGGDNLAATFSPELADVTLYVIDVSAGDKIPRKGGPGITRSDLLIINKIDLAPYVGADLGVMARDAAKMRVNRPFMFTNLRDEIGLPEVLGWLCQRIDTYLDTTLTPGAFSPSSQRINYASQPRTKQ